MKIKIFVLLLLFSFPIGALLAQTIKIDGEIRTRAEYRQGYRNPLADELKPSFVPALRSRLKLDYTGNKINARIQIQDSRIYGETGINDTKNGLGIYEAYGSYYFTPEFSISAGRQAIEYDDKRLISASNWSNTGNAHDLAIIKYESATLFNAHLGAAWNNIGDVFNNESFYNVNNSYKSMVYFWAQKSFKPVDVSIIWINDGFNYVDTMPTAMTFRNTLGANVNIQPKKSPFNVYATGYYQFGHNTRHRDLNAFMLALKADYTFAKSYKIGLGGDYYSGTDSINVANNKDNTFNKLYGSNSSFNGIMEYWRNIPTRGLVDCYGYFQYKYQKYIVVNAEYHFFAVPKKLSHDYQKTSIGSEIDLNVIYNASPSVAIQAGWSTYLKNNQTSFIKNQIGVDTHFPNWAYIMFTFKPQFLNTNIGK